MIAKFNELPENAQYVIMGAGGLVGLLIIIVFIMIIVGMFSGGGSDKEGKIKVPKRLPICPIPLLTPNEATLIDALNAVARKHDGHKVYAKVGTQAVIGSRIYEAEKIKKAINKSIIKDVYDFVMFDKEFMPVAIIEFESNEKDKREEQARIAGIPIVRISNPRMHPDEIELRMQSIFKKSKK